MGAEKLYNGLRLFGFGRKPAWIYRARRRAFVANVEMDRLQRYRIPFGQEITVTALQLVQGFCILANGGHNIRPHVIKAVVDNEGNIVKMTKAFPSYGYVIDLKLQSGLLLRR